MVPQYPDREQIFAGHGNMSPAAVIESAPLASQSRTRPLRHRGCQTNVTWSDILSFSMYCYSVKIKFRAKIKSCIPK